FRQVPARVGPDVTPPLDPAACGSLQTRIINRREGVCDWETLLSITLLLLLLLLTQRKH
ncbi:hypothetical protein ATANTOWER_027593, partial [Ataeniobius toweri]|nr:hypothetical protein [Ataeniobius toweri]